MNLDLGFRRDHLLTFFLPVPTERLREPERIVAFYQQLQERIQALPGVESASVSTGMPVRGTNFGMAFELASKPAADPSQRQGAGFNMVTPEYFRTFGIQMDKGRAFTPEDRAGGVRVAVVNQTFAKKYLADVDPLTQRLKIEELIPGVTRLGPAVEWQIVGVVPRRAQRRTGRRRLPGDRRAFRAEPVDGSSVAVRTRRSPAACRRASPRSCARWTRSPDDGRQDDGPVGGRGAGRQSVQRRPLRDVRGRSPCSWPRWGSTA
jgi:putative ABC transport system permease protein